MTLTGIQCNKCKDIIYSRARHDFRTCTCNSVFVDGGLDYFRWGALKAGSFTHVKIDILDVDEKKLYDDWNLGKDKYGLIKQKN